MNVEYVSRTSLLALLIMAGFAACSAAQPAVEVAPESAAEVAAAAAIPAKNVVALREHVGEEVTAAGHIDRVAKSSSGHQFLNFAGSELTAICFSGDVAKFTDGTPAELYADQDVEVTGKLQLYRGKLQIRITDPKQLRIVEVAPPEPVEVAEVTLKQIGEDQWMSPAGLRYAGRDPMGLTRVEHIGRHLRDIPDRDGPHGVFDGGQGVALAVIDEAWKLSQERDLRPNQEDDRSAVTVRMGRRVGYLGGRSGAAQDHPPLERVFIVYQTGTKNIITAFPK